MKKIVFAVLVLAGGWYLWAYSRPAVSSEAQASLQTVPVTRGSLAVQVQSTATITPENKLEIKPPVAGRAETVLVEIGAKVKQGQMLASMSSDERAALLDAARAKGAKEVKFWEDVYKAAPLVAPLDGEIISRTLIPGQVVQATDVVFIMSDHLIAQADMDETDLAKVFMKQKAIVTLDSYPSEKIEGQVSKIAYDSTTTNNVTTYKVDVTFANVPAHARSGMTANVSFITAEKNDVLLLPADAVTKGSVLIPSASSDGQPSAHQVQTGLTDGKFIEIVSGLKEGQSVVRSGYTLPSEPKQGMSILPRPGGNNKSNGPPPP